MGCRLMTESTESYFKMESGDQSTDTPTSSPSPQVEIVMGWAGHFSVVTIHTDNFHRKGYLMLHNLANATTHVAN